jgi:hypothetical protein
VESVVTISRTKKMDRRLKGCVGNCAAGRRSDGGNTVVSVPVLKTS